MATDGALDEAVLHDNTLSPRDDRKARGQAMREAIPHKLHATWLPPGNRPDPVQILEDSNVGRIPELIPVRYGRMLPNPFTFYRGAAAIMAWDLAHTPNTKIPVQACGDCHLLNFGAFATPERNIIFDINDFDETLPAPWEWDLKRLAVSFVLAMRTNGIKDKAAQAAVANLVRVYREQIIKYAHTSILDIWYDKMDVQKVINDTSEEFQQIRKDKVKKALKRTIQDYYFPKLTQQLNGQFVFRENKPLMYHAETKDRAAYLTKMERALIEYRSTLQEDRQQLIGRYRLADVAIKVVGIGSVGTTCLVALLVAADNEPLLLQLKEARESVLEPYVGKSVYDNCGRRVVAGQRIAQSASDIFLGWTVIDGKHFYVRQLRDTKIKVEPELWGPDQFAESAKGYGFVLARAHSRSGDAAVIRGYLGNRETFDEAIASFAIEYADQVENDYEALKAAHTTGRIKAIFEEDLAAATAD